MHNDPLKRVHIDQLLAHFRRGFEPFVIVVLKSTHGDAWYEVLRTTPEVRLTNDSRSVQLDATALVRVILAHWDTTFVRVLDKRDRALLYELRQIRNRWAHQAPLNDDDVDRMADAVLRLLTSIHADNIREVQQLRDELRVQRYGTTTPRIWRQSWMKWLVGGIGACVILAGVGWWYFSTVMPKTTATPSLKTALTTTTTPAQAAYFPCTDGQIKGNPNTMIYHKPDGAYYATTRNANVVCFESTTAAEKAGYRPSKR